MTVQAVANKYASALHNYAQEKNKINELEEDLKIVVDFLKENKKIKGVLEHPLLDREEKKEIVADIFKGLENPEIINLLKLLVDRKRFDIVEPLFMEYMRLANYTRNVAIAEVTTAIEVSDELQKEIKKALEKYTGKDVRLVMKTDPSILGGVITKIGDSVLDASITRRLARMYETITQGSL
ncbi:MAG: ATP synthase F1 subunit delta [Candidatus Syntrophonatronum acetioxidans]|uniref:ATP synthase subunit delta n=1 Tax=Candidatus Syntrophonatronum acetioxidans TaxID=1795816 RepID=A0A424YFY7_9FIRM|nr:MAG: ATP synthase F1 subunit delta [Candidatus Syntrophonatronum acetioxidans]